MNFFSKKNNVIGTLINFFLVLFFCFWIQINPARGAETYFNDAGRDFYAGQTISLDYFLNSRGEDINAIKGEITYPADFLELQQIRDGGSIVSFWIDRPEVKFGNTINFSGISSGGFKGEKGLVFSMVFGVKENKSGLDQESLVSARNLRIFLNDGMGTERKMGDANYVFVQKSKPADNDFGPNGFEDRDPPAVFSPYVTKDPAILNNWWILIFSAQDKNSGIDHYEVHETKERYSLEELNKKQLTWLTVKSPYLLQDQNLESYVYVKAVDRAGNERVAVVFPGKGKNDSYFEAIAISGIILIAITGLGFFSFKKIKRKD